MDKIKAFIKKNYILCISITVGLLLVLAIILTIVLVNKYKHKKVFREDTSTYYQYFLDEKYDFEGTISYQNNSIIDFFTKNNYKIMESTIIYDNNNDKFIFPTNMALILYYQNNKGYYLNKYSEVDFTNNKISININEKTNYYDYFFMYNGSNLYFFPIDVKLVIDNNEINLSKGSYVSTSEDNIIYYDYASKSINMINEYKKCKVIINDVEIDIINNIVNNGSKTDFLLNKIEMYEEMK